MIEKQIKLIIWDFDGVIADTEKLWLLNRQKLINQKFNLDWTFSTTNKYLGGMSDKTKREVLNKLGIQTNNNFWENLIDMDNKIIDQGFPLTPYIEDIFKLKQFKQCIATGGTTSKTIKKIETVGIWKYFDKKSVFTADMVDKGKPAPDIFLLAAKNMGVSSDECIVIEDSLAGMKAGLTAQMLTVAFIGCEMNNNNDNIHQIQQLGIKHIFRDMITLKNFLLTLNI